MEQIIIDGIEVDTIIGVYDWERTKPQTLIVDLELTADLSAAGKSDDVADTIDYAKVVDLLVAVAKESEYQLLEALAQTFSDSLFAQFELSQLILTITKPGILANTQKVAVRIHRKR